MSKSVTLHRVPLIIRQELCRHNLMSLANSLDVQSWIDSTSHRVVLEFRACIWGENPLKQEYHRTFHDKCPKDWFQALKERFAPRWVTRRWPVP